MPKVPFITAAEVEDHLTWPAVADAMAAGHAEPQAEIGDQFLYRGDDTLLSRAAWVDGLGVAVKSVVVMPGNAPKNIPTVQGALTLFEDVTGSVEAIIDSILITKWKTAGDSLLGARLLARPNSRKMAILGAGAVSRSLIDAYRAEFGDLDIVIWNRTRSTAEELAAKTAASVAQTPEEAVRGADIVATATMSQTPVLKGEWLSPGTHVDLIGAFTPAMREADDEVLRRGRIFVDSRETTLDHIGELKIPLAEGVITPEDIIGDFYQMCAGTSGRETDDEITVFKNGGGAHLDLMTGRLILRVYSENT